MENLKDSFSISKLIAKSFGEELSAEEQRTLDQWLSEPKHRELYRRMQQKDLQTKRQELASLHPREGWHKLEKQITFHTHSLRLRFWQYAAIFILPLVVSSVIYMTYHKDFRPETELSVVTPLPGSSKATLTLSSGEKVELQNLHVRVDSNIRLENTNNTLKVATLATTAASKEIYQELSIPIGGEYRLILSDGTKIWLNSDSRLRFPGTFTGPQRVVYLEGEAYFEVAHDTNQPFIVNTAGIAVEVLGTKFNVKAYAEDSFVYTTLAEGSVRTIDTKTNTFLLLSPDEQSQYSKMTGQLKKRHVDAQTFIGWREGKFIFENETLEEVMKQLNRWYNTQVIYQTPEIKNYRFTGYVNRFTEISTILRMIEKTYDITFNIQGNIITVNQR